MRGFNHRRVLRGCRERQLMRCPPSRYDAVRHDHENGSTGRSVRARSADRNTDEPRFTGRMAATRCVRRSCARTTSTPTYSRKIGASAAVFAPAPQPTSSARKASAGSMSANKNGTVKLFASEKRRCTRRGTSVNRAPRRRAEGVPEVGRRVRRCDARKKTRSASRAFSASVAGRRRRTCSIAGPERASPICSAP
jgi:hypothetical protein